MRHCSNLKQELAWSIYPFKGGEQLPQLKQIILAHKQSDDDRVIKLSKNISSLAESLDLLVKNNLLPEHINRENHSDVSHQSMSKEQCSDKEETNKESYNNKNDDNIKKTKTERFVVTKEEFFALPESTRGRAKFDETKSTMSIIVNAFRKKTRSKDVAKGGKTEPLSLKELDAKGGKCVGHTGASVLASLRALGLIDVSRSGIVMVHPMTD